MATFPYEEITVYGHAFKTTELVDQIFKKDVLLDRMKKSGRVMIDGGTQVEVALEFAKGNGGNFDGAHDTLTTSHKKIADYAVLPWKYKYSQSDITLKDRVKNRGKAKILDLVDSRFRSMEKTMSDLLSTGIFAASATTTEELDGLGLAIDTNKTYAGIDNNVDTWWAAAQENTTATLSATVLRDMWGACYNNSREFPTIIVGTQANFDRYWTIVQGKMTGTNIGSDQAGIGWPSLIFNGIPFVADSHCTTNGIYMLNENHVKLFISEEANFLFTGWKEPVNQPAASIGYTLFGGNLLVDNPGSCAKNISLTA